jgi:hypothetical protein
MGAQNVDRRYKENVCFLKSSLVVSKYPRSFLVENLQPDSDIIIVGLILTLSHVCFCFDIVSRRSCFVLGEDSGSGLYWHSIQGICQLDRDAKQMQHRDRAFLNNPRAYFLQ